jgi:voltage-gated sodium channel
MERFVYPNLWFIGGLYDAGHGIRQDGALKRKNPMKNRLEALVYHPRFEAGIITLIIINALTLGLETVPAVMEKWGGLLHRLDRLFLAVFTAEIVAKISVRGRRFFKDPWSVFDFMVVGIALLPASGPLSVLRALRVLRTLRLVTALPSLKRVVAGLLAAIPGLGAVGAVLILVFYVAAVMATKLFGPDFPQWFGSVPQSAFSLFQIMTLESWSMGIVRPVMELFPYAWIFFVPFILVATFVMLNLFMAVIVNSMHLATTEDIENHSDTEKLARQIEALREELNRYTQKKSG